MPTVKEVIAKLTESVGHIENTVDTLKSGDGDNEVIGIGVTFMPSYHVLQQAIAHGLNFIIAHEALYYHHRDEIDVLQNDPVYLAKKRLIDESGIAVFRLHDHIHRQDPDKIVQGLIHELGWNEYVDHHAPNTLMPLHTYPLSIPTRTVREVAEHLKIKLGVPFLRIIGDLSMPCSRVGLLPGYCGSGALAIPFFQHANLDLIIVGEGPEWETPEYVRDAVAQGINKALIVLGHQSSEEWGMKYLSQSLKDMYPTIPVEFLTEEQPFQVI